MRGRTRQRSRDVMMQRLARIEGGCHCGNIRFELQWPQSETSIAVRHCSCTFCQKHGGAWTSHRDAELAVEMKDPALVSKYRFGTKTADFYVCAKCGAVPFVACDIGGQTYAVVNINTFKDLAGWSLNASRSNFDGEGTGDRLDRRQRNWIPRVQIAGAG
ncbi:MAG TPA: hypothetical protein VLB07_10110 [Woeseiaceae bacterium]|nr:hypothetical protein [Woeseiaceae bacterium]